MAIDPEEMAILVSSVHNVHESLGGFERIVSQEEKNQREVMRRSIVFASELKKGTKLKAEDLDVKRPGTGIPPDQLTNLIGDTLARDVEANTLVVDSDFLKKK